MSGPSMPADPAVVVDRYIQVHFVAAGAELGALLSVKRLQKGLAVGRRG